MDNFIYRIIAMTSLVFMASQCVSCSAQDNWITYQGETFRIEHPVTWQVADQPDGSIHVTGAQAEVVLWPGFIEWAIQPAQAGKMLAKLAGQQVQGITWEVPMQVGNHFSRMQGQSVGGQKAVAFLQIVPGMQGSMFSFYACSGLVEKYASLEPTFVRIITSFRPVKELTPGNSPTPPPLQYAVFKDPLEQSFTLEYPKNWKIEGGLYRAAATDTRTHVRINAPDDGIQIFIGDKTLPYFTMPNAMLEFTGFREGSWYSPGYGVQMLVRRYYPGVNFAAEYAQALAQGNTEIIEQNDRPELARQLMGVQETYNYGVYQRMDAGDVRFRFTDNSGNHSGFVLAATTMVNTGGNGIWHAEQLLGFVCTPEKTDEAKRVLEHIVKTFSLNPQWVAMQQQLTRNVSEIVAQTNNHISNTIRETFENRQQSQDRSARRFDDYIRGVERVMDENGKVYEVKSGNNYYWINAFEETVGTDVFQNPDVMQFRELVKIN